VLLRPEGRARLKANWIEVHNDDLSDWMSAEQLKQLDAFDHLQLSPSSKSAAAEFSVGWGLFTHPCARPAPASQARGPDRDAPASCLLRPSPASCPGVRRMRLTLTDYRPLLLPCGNLRSNGAALPTIYPGGPLCLAAAAPSPSTGDPPCVRGSTVSLGVHPI
jgi:hypothetical protein